MKVDKVEGSREDTETKIKVQKKVKTKVKTSRVLRYLSVVSLLVPAHGVIDLVLCPHPREVSPALEVDPILVEAIHLSVWCRGCVIVW
jgi:hypothetical protein